MLSQDTFTEREAPGTWRRKHMDFDLRALRHDRPDPPGRAMTASSKPESQDAPMCAPWPDNSEGLLS